MCAGESVCPPPSVLGQDKQLRGAGEPPQLPPHTHPLPTDVPVWNQPGPRECVPQTTPLPRSALLPRGLQPIQVEEYFALACLSPACFHCFVLRLCYSTALCFTCAWYCSIVTAGLLHLLVVQVINISHNVTEREARLALREKSARSTYWGLVVDTGVYSRGFRGNWTEFLTMGDKWNTPSVTPTDLV